MFLFLNYLLNANELRIEKEIEPSRERKWTIERSNFAYLNGQSSKCIFATKSKISKEINEVTFTKPGTKLHFF